tara:strand:+ start:2133 stop:2357 length:225 start_codon:yes stop_codon:yes gene_type:complete
MCEEDEEYIPLEELVEANDLFFQEDWMKGVLADYPDDRRIEFLFHQLKMMAEVNGSLWRVHITPYNDSIPSNLS